MAVNQSEDNLEVELAISDDRINPTIDKARANLSRFVGEVNTTKITIGQHLAVDFAAIEKRTNTLRTNLQDIAKARIDAGNIGAFTKEIVGAGDRVRVLQREIANTQKILERPHSPYFTELLQKDLKAATTELGTLEAKLDRVGKKNLLPPGSATRPQVGRGGNLINGLSSAAGAALSATGSPINETELQAVSAVAEHLGITLASVETAIAGISSGFLLTAGAVAAAGLIAIQYSRSVREEAERNLKVQTALAVSYGEQYNTINKIKNDFQNAQFDIGKNADDVRRDAGISETPLDVLVNRQKTLQSLINGNAEYYKDPNNQALLDYQRESKAIQAYLVKAPLNNKDLQFLKEQNVDTTNFQGTYERKKLDDASFQQNWDNYVAGVDRAKEAEEQRRKAFAKSVEEGKTKLKELGKQYTSTFEGLFKQQDSDNPFSKVFLAGDEALTKLRENLRGAGPELLKIAEDMQNRANDLALYNTRLDTRLSAFSLQEDADKFRNPKNPQLDQDQLHSIVQRSILGSNSVGEIYRKTYAQSIFDAIPNGGKFTPEQERSAYEAAALRNIQQADGDKRPFTFGLQDKDLTLNEKSLVTSLANRRLEAGQNLTIQQRLEKQFGIIDSLKASSPEEKDAANRRIIALTQGLNPNDLTSNQRERAAAARESDANRLLKAESDAKEERKKEADIREKTKDVLDALLPIVKSLGEKGLEALIRVQDETTGKKVKGVEDNKRPSGKSTDDYYNRK